MKQSICLDLATKAMMMTRMTRAATMITTTTAVDWTPSATVNIPKVFKFFQKLTASDVQSQRPRRGED